MGVNVGPGFAEEVTNGLSSLDEILEIHEMHNRFDLLLKIRAKNLDKTRDIVVNKIRTFAPHPRCRIDDHFENQKRRTDSSHTK